MSGHFRTHLSVQIMSSDNTCLSPDKHYKNIWKPTGAIYGAAYSIHAEADVLSSRAGVECQGESGYQNIALHFHKSVFFALKYGYSGLLGYGNLELTDEFFLQPPPRFARWDYVWEFRWNFVYGGFGTHLNRSPQKTEYANESAMGRRIHSDTFSE